MVTSKVISREATPVNQFDKKDLENDPTLADVQSRVQANPVAVVNLDHVTGGAYAGGFGGKVVSGALASAGNGGLSLLGKFGTVDLANLLQVVQGYVPFISYAGVHSDATTVETTSGNKISDPDDPGFTVSATRLDQSDTQSGSAGGYIGYGSGRGSGNLYGSSGQRFPGLFVGDGTFDSTCHDCHDRKRKE